jgi:hypothetical protein
MLAFSSIIPGQLLSFYRPTIISEICVLVFLSTTQIAENTNFHKIQWADWIYYKLIDDNIRIITILSI